MTNDALVIGKTYRFKTRSKNGIDYSEYSDESYIAFGGVPNTPDIPNKVYSTKSSIRVSWTAPAATDLDITGYILNMDDGKNGDIKPIFIGSNRPDILAYTVGDL